MNKVVIIINSLGNGGAEKVVKLLMERLYKVDSSIELICLEQSGINRLDFPIKISYLSSFNGTESGIKKLLFMPLLAFKLMKYVKINKIDLVQSHLFRANYINILSKLLFCSDHIIQVVNHTIISSYLKEGLLGKINLFLIKWLYPSANMIISVSNIVQIDMQSMFNFNNRLEVIYNPFDIKYIKKQAQEIIIDFNFDIRKKYIISVGRLVKLKRNKDLIYALSKLDDNIELLFIGEGNEKDRLIKLSIELNILNRIHFLGWVDNPYKYIRNSNIFISASETESFGNVLVESMICGTAVITTNCGGPSEIVENKKSGIVVDIGEIDQLVQSIRILILDKNVKNKYIQNAYIKIEEFGVLKIIKQYKNILRIYKE